MASYLGVDWASGCWLVVKTGDETLVTTEPSILNVWHEHGGDVESILVDIPTGLLSSESRACDEEASERLGARGSTVFSIPFRGIVETNEYPEARKLNDGSLGSQSWWLFPRIREVDVFLQEYEEARMKTHESHPEICFDALADDLQHSKNTEEGRKERLKVLEENDSLYTQVTEKVGKREDGAEWHHRISKGRIDDVLDAAVLALTAKKLKLGSRREEPQYPALPVEKTAEEDDQLGISPEIVLPPPS